MAKRLPADGLAAIRAALRPSARGLRSRSSQGGKAGKPSAAPLDTPRNAAGAGARAGRAARPAPPRPVDQAAMAGYDARVADVEASLARAFRMLQVQLEAVDRKIDGEVGAVRGELAALLEEDYQMHKGMKREIAFLKDELSSMNALLERLADTEAALDPQTKEWRSQVREMSYDIEDCIDEYTRQLRHGRPQRPGGGNVTGVTPRLAFGTLRRPPGRPPGVAKRRKLLGRRLLEVLSHLNEFL